MKANREEVLEAAKIIKKCCLACINKGCDCPLHDEEDDCIVSLDFPVYWHLDLHEARKRKAAKK